MHAVACSLANHLPSPVAPGFALFAWPRLGAGVFTEYSRRYCVCVDDNEQTPCIAKMGGEISTYVHVVRVFCVPPNGGPPGALA